MTVAQRAQTVQNFVTYAGKTKKRMATRGLPGRLWLGLALIVVPFLVLIGLLAYEVVGLAPSLVQSRELVTHTYEVIDTARALERAMQDAERGQRGYLLTGDAAYLEPYRSGARDAPRLLARLFELTRDNPEQQRRSPNLELQVNARLAVLQRVLEIRDRSGLDAARDAMLTDGGLIATRAIDTLIDATVATENGLLGERLTRMGDEERRGADVALWSAVFAFATMAMGIVVALLTFRGVQRAEKAQGLSEQRFRLLVDGVADHAIYTLDPNGNVVDWNAGAQRLKGYSAEEIIGQHFSRFYTEEDRNADVPKRALEAALRDGKHEGDGWRVRKDGSRFWSSVIISPLRDASGRLVGFAKVTRDITERREQQLALEQAHEALAQAQKMEALGQLSGGVAHDFNNLLHVISNCVEIVQRRLYNADAETRQFLDMVKRSASRAASLTQRMLAFSRRQPLQPRPISPNRLVSGMVDLLQRALGESIELETVLGGRTWTVSVDPNQLESALLNLAVNARDAMPGGGKLTIETSNTFLDEVYAAANAEVKEGQYAMIAVSDTGIGMTEEVREKAFDPFFTTKDSGTGLGLSQVYGFIKQSGGHIKIYSEASQGTTVKLYLPRLAGVADEDARETGSRLAPIGSERILVVEDDDDVRAFTAEVLRELGYEVLVASDAASALRVLDDGSDVRLLFTDVGLPNGVNGRQLANQVRDRRPEIKVLFTTGYARNAIVHHGRLDPDVELIVKPYTQSALAEKIRRVLDGA
jgi:PAS domain S-box-containing protein